MMPTEHPKAAKCYFHCGSPLPSKNPMKKEIKHKACANHFSSLKQCKESNQRPEGAQNSIGVLM